jgi:hypothetical protein
MANSPFYKLLFAISLRFYILKVATRCIQRIYSPVFRIRNVLVRIRIRGSALDYGSDPALISSGFQDADKR